MKPTALACTWALTLVAACGAKEGTLVPAPAADASVEGGAGSSGVGGAAGSGGMVAGGGGGTAGSAGTTAAGAAGNAGTAAAGTAGNAGAGGCSKSCNDNLTCTTDTCKGSTCDNAIDSQFCVINNACVAASAIEGTNKCRACQPGQDQHQYSDVADGSPCGQDLVCFKGQCTTCVAGQACTPPSKSCKTGKTSCSTGQSTCAEDASLPDGKSCESSGICIKGECFKCPLTTGGGAMVPIIGGYCIDSTEVTRSQYQAWLATNPIFNGRPTECSWNNSWEAQSDCLDSACTSDCDNHPQVCIDWCDAQAYCADAGKKLCGLVGGGEYPYPPSTAFSLGVTSEWSNACSAGGENTYPYGDNYTNGLCHVGAGFQSKTLAVAAKVSCKSSVPGYLGHYDLSGNVEEWIDSCEKKNGQWDYCLAAGGYYNTTSDAVNFTCSYAHAYDRNARESRRGFRCCWSP